MTQSSTSTSGVLLLARALPLLCLALLLINAPVRADLIPTQAEIDALNANVPADGYIVFGLGNDWEDWTKQAYGIWRYRLRETTPIELARTGMCPCINPYNSDIIAYSEPVNPKYPPATVQDTGLFNIVLINADGGQRRVITKAPLPNIWYLHWTDQSKIVFTSSSSVSKFEPTCGETNGANIMDTLGNVKRISALDNPTSGGYDLVLAWGNHLVYWGAMLPRSTPRFLMYQFDQSSAAVGPIQTYCGECGVEIRPDGKRYVYNSYPIHTSLVFANLENLKLGAFQSNTACLDNVIDSISTGGYNVRYSNDFAYSQDTSWGVFITEEENGSRTNPLRNRIWVLDIPHRKYTLHSWLGNRYAHNPDMWVGSWRGSSAAMPPSISWTIMAGDSFTVTLTAGTTVSAVYYTIDGADPTEASPRYQTPFGLKVTGDADTIKARTYIAGKQPSPVARAVINRLKLLNPVIPVAVLSGLDYGYFEGTLNTLPDFSSLTPVRTGIAQQIDLTAQHTTTNFGFQFTGYIKIATAGIYTFYLSSDDGSRLWIDDSLIVNNDGVHLSKEVSGSVGLAMGYHRIRVGYFQQTSSSSLVASYSATDIGVVKKDIPALVLFRNDPASIPHVLRPLAGSSYSLGDTIEVAWTYQPNGLTYLALSLNSGKSYRNISEGIQQSSDTMKFRWKLPRDSLSFATTTACIKVQDYVNGDISGRSGLFAIKLATDVRHNREPVFNRAGMENVPIYVYSIDGRLLASRVARKADWQDIVSKSPSARSGIVILVKNGRASAEIAPRR